MVDSFLEVRYHDHVMDTEIPSASSEAVQIQNKTQWTTQQIFICILIFILGFILGIVFQITVGKTTDILIPLPTPTPFIELTPTPTIDAPLEIQNNPSPTPTPLPTTSKLKSSVCPVQFTVPAGRIYVTNKGQYATWQLREVTERFFFLPRAEEVNGRKVSADLRLENQQYYNGESQVVVQCQDNANHWSQDDFFSYVLKSDTIKDPLMTKVSLWNQTVGKLVYTTTYDGRRDTVWLLSNPSTLFHAKTIVFDEKYRIETENIFNTLVFY